MKEADESEYMGCSSIKRELLDCAQSCCLSALCFFFPFKIVCMAPDVLSAVKKESTRMAENVNHATVPVQHVQVPPTDICLHNFHSCIILPLVSFHYITVTV